MISCASKPQEDPDVLLRFGNETITRHEIIEKIPDGISPSDSAEFFRAIVDSWIKDVVLSDFAEERLIDTEEIDRKVKDYRNNLIVLEYLRRMRENRSPKIDEQRIKEYYTAHRNELKLEVPIIKGIFLKINSDTPQKEKIKELLSSDDPEKIDILEREWVDRSLQYSYFRDKWIDWETVKGLIPYRFGDPDKFLEENSYFETEYGDCSYYLTVTDWIPSGEEQPIEFARTWISDLLTQGELTEYERNLVNSLVERNIKEKKLETIGYDPITHKLKDRIEKEI